MGTPEGKQGAADLFVKRNEVVRIDVFDELDDHLEPSLRRFFRLLRVPHLYEERIVPALKAGNPRFYAAVRDRPWPRWGPGARNIAALCHVESIGEGLYGLSPIYVADEDATNLGLVAALFKEVLEGISSDGKAEVAFLVHEGSVMASRVLGKVGFEPTDDVVLTDDARYTYYRADARELLERLGLAKLSVPELLAQEIDDDAFDRTALFHSALNVGGRPHQWEDITFREIISIVGGLFQASLPGGVPPTPPTALAKDPFEGRGPVDRPL